MKLEKGFYKGTDGRTFLAPLVKSRRGLFRIEFISLHEDDLQSWNVLSAEEFTEMLEDGLWD